VAYENHELVGFAYVNVKRTLMKNILLGELGIFVGESHRGKGIGNKLIANLLLFSKKYNVRVVYLTVLSDNVRAIRLYQKYGFKKVGITLDKWKGKTYESIIMKKTF
jgi:RimJ/RimL family protein N-acetyltransferase